MDSLPITNQARKALVAIIVGIMVVISAVLMSIAFNFTIVGNLVMSWILTTAYALFAFFLIDPHVTLNPIRIVEKPIIHEVPVEVEKEVIREIQVPIENRVIEVVEKPVVKEVFIEVPVEKRITRYIERKHRSKKLNIPRFNFVGSNQTHRFHKRACRLGKLIKKKYKVHSNTKAFFKKKHYHACKACMKK